jgi:hypothetical protein
MLISITEARLLIDQGAFQGAEVRAFPEGRGVILWFEPLESGASPADATDSCESVAPDVDATAELDDSYTCTTPGCRIGGSVVVVTGLRAIDPVCVECGQPLEPVG